MERKQEVSKAVIQRLPRYYRNICELKAEGVQRISSRSLAERMGLTASQIRQDFNCFGGFGQQGYGYNIDKLMEELGSILGLRAGRTAILIGAGNLGRALLKNFDFAASGFTLLCAFDSNPEVIRIGIEKARTSALFYFVLAYSHSVAAVMRGAGKAVVPMVVMLIFWCIIRVAFLTVAVPMTQSILTVYWVYPMTWVMSSIAFFIYYKKADWLHITG